MQLVEKQIDGEYILISDDVLSNIQIEHFNPDYLIKNYSAEKVSTGRGQVWRFCLQEKNCILRHYRRGGWAAAVSEDQYLWLGLRATRVWREMHLLAQLYNEEFPVPKVVVGRVKKSGLVYSCDLVTEQISNAEALSVVLQSSALPASKWRDIGKMIKRFHMRGVFHADLNAHNILFSGNDVYLIDFDKCKINRLANYWQQANLDRLERSLNKLKMQDSTFGFGKRDWVQLISGYNNE